jgi:glycosyltransferase involved in cell wall biosynthesis
MLPVITILSPSLSHFNVMLSHYEWFNSLKSNAYELIIVDQNIQKSDELEKKATENEYFTYIHNEERGLSKNRNIGSKYARGEYIFFLDDNARFDKKMADRILRTVEGSIFDIYLGAIIDWDGNLTSYTPNDKECVLNVLSVEGHVNSNGILAQARLVNEQKFDEMMGVGSNFGSCEEIDFVVRSLISGKKVKYLPTIQIIHPPKPYDEKKAFDYGRGHGYFTSKLLFLYPSISCKYLALKKISKCLIKYFLSIVLFRSSMRRNYRAWAHGFIQGFCKGI